MKPSSFRIGLVTYLMTGALFVPSAFTGCAADSAGSSEGKSNVSLGSGTVLSGNPPSNVGTASTDNSACSDNAQPLSLAAFDLLMVMDKSGSMRDSANADEAQTFLDKATAAAAKDCTENGPFLECPRSFCTSLGAPPKTKWEATRTAIETFLEDSSTAGMRVSLSLFPQRSGKTDACNASQYATPVVPFGEIPAVAASVKSKLDAINSDELGNQNDGTPMHVAMVGAMAQATAWAKSNPARNTAIVLVTDGAPTGYCKGDKDATGDVIEPIVETVKAGAGGTPKVATYVIGIPIEGAQRGGVCNVAPTSTDASLADALDQIALAGSGTKSVIVGQGQELTASLVQSISNVRKQAVPCDYAIPTKANLDPTFVTVKYASSSGAQTDLPFVNGIDQCKGPGWSYDVTLTAGGAQKPTQVKLCPTSCEASKADAGAKVNLAFSCTQNSAIVATIH